MRIIRVAILVGVTLCGTVAWATDEGTFLGVLKKFGITDNGSTSRKPCLCTGGTFGGLIGSAVVFQTGGGEYKFDCSVAGFSPAGDVVIGANCRATGGTVTLVEN
jgi:hypothetical protein